MYLKLHVQNACGTPSFITRKVPSTVASNAPNSHTTGTLLGSVTYDHQEVIEFSLSTEYYDTEASQFKYLINLSSGQSGEYLSFYNYGNSAGKNPALIVKYRPKAWGTDPTGAAQPMKFVLKNGTNYLLSNGGTVTARVPQAKETIDAEDFYYCEWVFNYNSTYYAHTISPAYDEELCLKANSDGTVSLVAIADG